MSIAIGTYDLKQFFLSSLGEKVETWNKYSDYLLKYWLVDCKFKFTLFELNGTLYINLTEAINNYTIMPNPLTTSYNKIVSYVWMEKESKEEITGTKLTDWSSIRSAAGITDVEAANNFYKGSVETLEKKLEQAKKDYYKKYGDIPAYVQKIVYTAKSGS